MLTCGLSDLVSDIRMKRHLHTGLYNVVLLAEKHYVHLDSIDTILTLWL